MGRFGNALIFGLLSCLAVPAAHAGDEVVGIGVLTDMTGSLSPCFGPGSGVAAKMAVEEFGSTLSGRAIEVLVANHRNKADVALGVLRKWYDVDNVTAVFDLENSAAALAAQKSHTREKSRWAPRRRNLRKRIALPMGFSWGMILKCIATGLPGALWRRVAKPGSWSR
jgi:branched-chain amino acid transport system substrate-binding protein